MTSFRNVPRRLKLRHYLFLLVFLSGIVPLAVNSLYLTARNRELLETQEKSHLTHSARSVSVELSDYFRSLRRRLQQLGASLSAVPAPGGAAAALRQGWLRNRLQSFLAANPELEGLRVLEIGGAGPQLPATLSEVVRATLDEAFTAARGGTAPVYRFISPPSGERPRAVMAVPVATGGGEPTLVVEGVVRLDPMEMVFQREAVGDVTVFLIDRRGVLLYAEGATADAEVMRRSGLVQDFVRRPVVLTHEFTVEVGGKERSMLGQVSPVEETGWGVVVQKPTRAIFTGVRQMVLNTVLSTVLLVLLALAVTLVAARTISRPIQQLAERSYSIAEGEFGARVPTAGPGVEFGRLAEAFNRMSGHLEDYIGRLREAAESNRALFVGSLRAFAAAIDAKDPYTRGHSERVAGLSRTIARHLGLSDEVEDRVWVAALLHDVGKIGVDDRILKKGSVLTPEEYEQMKLHTVIGAEIMSPIRQLEEMIPAIRWHHEDWNGRGYPDGLRGDQIPLIARIVAVADCFDAITKRRPYQQPFPLEQAVETVVRLAGGRFDAKVVTAFLKAYKAGDLRSVAEAGAGAEVEVPRMATS